MAKIIGFIIRKGGTGKTMSAVNIAHILSVSGYRVLFIDLDSQTNSTEMLMENAEYQYADFKKLFCTNFSTKGIFYDEYIYETNYNMLSCIPSSPELDTIIYDIYDALKVSPNAMLCLRQNLELVSDDFDYVIIDTNPGNTTLNYASICACDGILSPIKADNFSYVGVTDLLTTINDLKSRYDISPDFMGMFFADVNTSASGFKQLKEYYEKEYRDLFIPISIRHSVFVSDSTIANLPLLHINKKHPATEDYLQLVRYLRLIDEEHSISLQRFLAAKFSRNANTGSAQT